jgi:hypothetical protein
MESGNSAATRLALVCVTMYCSVAHCTCAIVAILRRRCLNMLKFRSTSHPNDLPADIACCSSITKSSISCKGPRTRAIAQNVDRAYLSDFISLSIMPAYCTFGSKCPKTRVVGIIWKINNTQKHNLLSLHVRRVP